MFILKIFYTYINYIFVSCAENKKVPISGADVTSDNNTDNSPNTSDDSKISVSDNIEAKDKTKEEVLIEELVEVGDRVFFDYDKSRFKNEGVETLKRQARFLLENKGFNC